MRDSPPPSVELTQCIEIECNGKSKHDIVLGSQARQADLVMARHFRSLQISAAVADIRISFLAAGIELIDPNSLITLTPSAFKSQTSRGAQILQIL